MANELGVEIEIEPFRSEILIQDLVSGLNDVTVIGRVIIIYPQKIFTRSDGSKGKIVRLFIADKSETLKLVLWSEKANLVIEKRIEEGQIIKVLHGYTREGMDGKIEVHVGSRGNILVSPPEAIEQEYPPIKWFMQKIGKLTEVRRTIHMQGIVKRVYPISFFERKSGENGKVLRLLLEDDTGHITIVFWNEKIDELGEVIIGDFLRLMDARIRENRNGELEVHTKNMTKIKRETHKNTKKVDG